MSIVSARCMVLASLGVLFIAVVCKLQYYKKILQKFDIIETLSTDASDYWVLNGWTNTLQKMNYDADIIFFGNSITCMSDFQKSFPDKNIINLGYPGDSMKGMMLRMAVLKAVKPEKVFIMAGINGLKVMDRNQFAAEYKTLVDSVQTSLPQLRFFFTKYITHKC